MQDVSFTVPAGRTLGVIGRNGSGKSTMLKLVAGITKRAPERWQRLGLEWLYRLLQEPRRMFKRYVTTNTRFVAMVARERLRASR